VYVVRATALLGDGIFTLSARGPYIGSGRQCYMDVDSSYIMSSKGAGGMVHKIRIGVVFGGKSGEHEVSIQSAKSVMAALDTDKYEIVPIGIDKAGQWSTKAGAMKLLATSSSEGRQIGDAGVGVSTELAPVPTDAGLDVMAADASAVIPRRVMEEVDVLLPVLHGSFGEDGTVQGLFELVAVPYVGAGVAASAVGMDKILMKRIFAATGLPQVRFVECSRLDWDTQAGMVTARIEAEIGYPCFVKPANLGSSVGISKVKSRFDLAAAIRLAAAYDRRLIVEEGLDVREIEVAVLGNEQPRASVLGEVLPANEFYDYQAKYVDGTSDLVIPAQVTEEQAREINDIAVRAFQAIDCAGLARVDFFIEKRSGRVLLNEINTMPGFTQYSMYPKLWEASGVSYKELIDQLVMLALERYQERQRTRTDFEPES